MLLSEIYHIYSMKNSSFSVEKKKKKTELAAESLMSRNGQDVSFMPHQKDRYIYFTIYPILFMIVAITNNVAEIYYLLDLYVLLHLASRVTALCHVYFSSLGVYLVFNSVCSSAAQEHDSAVSSASLWVGWVLCKGHIQKPPEVNIHDMLLIKKMEIIPFCLCMLQLG